MSDKHEGVTDWEAAARIAMARAERAERELDALRVKCLDNIEETRGSLSDLLDKIAGAKLTGVDLDTCPVCGRVFCTLVMRTVYDADPIPPSDADPGL